MPIHDWSRVRANRFHHFHQTWTTNLAAALNAGRLPAGFFALAEQITGGREADVVALELTPRPVHWLSSFAVETVPPKARIVTRSEASIYARKSNRVTIRHPDGAAAVIKSSHRATKIAAMRCEHLRGRRSRFFTPASTC